MISHPPYFIVYLLSLVALLWFYCFSILFLLKRPLKKNQASAAQTRPFVSILVPFHNESSYVQQKIRNLLESDLSAFDYEILLIDGHSSDDSCEQILQVIKDHKEIRLLRSPLQGKVHQLNFALQNLDPRTTFIANTDMDTVTDKDAIRHLTETLSSDENIGAAGAQVVPGYPLRLDHAFWQDQNFLRQAETNFYSSSSVVAPLYAFKRECVGKFPEDCIADDLFVSFECNRKGKRVVCVESARAVELRGPKNMSEYFRHKFRKAIANMRETYRFLNQRKDFAPRWKFIFLNRFGQLAIAPFAFFFFGLLSLAYLWLGTRESVSLVALAMSVGILSAAVVMRKKKLPARTVSAPHLAVISLVITNIVLIAVHCTYPFIRNDSKYRKVG